MSFSIGRAATPPRLILVDAGNVRMVYKTSYRAETIARWLSLDVEAVNALIHRSFKFHQLERGGCIWEDYVSFVETAVRSRISSPDLWNRERFAAIWVEALTEPIEPVLEILEALARHVPIASASNTDEMSYGRGSLRDPRVTAMLRVHSDSHFIGRRKGDEDYFETLLAYVNVRLQAVRPIRPDECVFIDDVVDHVTVAATRGIRTCWFADVTSPQALEDSVDQLKKDLQRHGVPDEWLSQ